MTLYSRVTTMASSERNVVEASQSTRSNKIMVAAIDFGTTYSGWAFSFKTEYQENPTKIFCRSWNSGKHISLKAPTTVLIKPDGRTIEAFGYEAEDRYAELVDDDEHGTYYYFQRFKMLLYDNKTLKRNDQLEDINGKRLSAKTVFSLVLRYLRDDLLEDVENKIAGHLEDDEIQWVLTVPAIWNLRAKQFMRQCAVEAGIKSKNLLIALEPEAASMYCKNLEIHKKNTGESDGQMLCAFQPGAQYIIVDAGGGTVDVIAHKVTANGSLEEISEASGGDWGGTCIDKAFLGLVSDVYGEDIIKRLKNDHVDDYLELLRDIEIQKRKTTLGSATKLKLKIPATLNEMYNTKNEESVTEKIRRNYKLNGHMELKKDKLFFDQELIRGIFHETSKHVVAHLRNILSNAIKTVDVILMVGGFSESPMLFDAVKSAFGEYKVLLPFDAGLSVLKGAVIFGHNRKDVIARVSPYTYGFCVNLHSYDTVRYDDSHLLTDSNGKIQITDVFCRLIKIHEQIPTDGETDSRGACPPDGEDGYHLTLFASKDPDPLYVDDASCFEVGSVYVNCKDDDGNVGSTKVCLKFGGTEVEAKATLKSNGKLTTTAFNFLD